ncbi:hypothetical protein UJ101_01754 [Flavobacteriaceae bacterium UJ101]|nr:hypothetical protein UJ101_01754 [Flavobacteriaceae bacterium UJ101]
MFTTNMNLIYSKCYYSFIKKANEIEQAIKKALKSSCGITHTQLNILSILEQEYPNPVNSNFIKNNLIISSSPDLTRLIDRLVKKELVERYTCPTNRREVNIVINPKGIETYKKAHKHAKQVTKNYFSEDLTEEEARTLYKILSKINI